MKGVLLSHGSEERSMTQEIKQFAEAAGIDLFGIANLDHMNEQARPGRRPKDLYPYAKSVIIFGCGMADPFCRGWTRNGKERGTFSLTLLELERRCRLFRRFFRERGGYHTFGGEILGVGYFHVRPVRSPNTESICRRALLSAAGPKIRLKSRNTAI